MGTTKKVDSKKSTKMEPKKEVKKSATTKVESKKPIKNEVKKSTTKKVESKKPVKKTAPKNVPKKEIKEENVLVEIKDENANKDIVNKFPPKKSFRLYIGYTTRIIFLTLCVLLLIFAVVVLIFKYIKLSNDEFSYIDYQSRGNVSYRINLKDNDYYDEKYLDSDKYHLFIAKLIDSINVNFDYDFTSGKEMDMEFYYNVVANLKVKSLKDGGNYFEKEYVLKDVVKLNKESNTNKHISDTVVIDYDYYNSLASKMKNEYGLEADGELEIKMNIWNNSSILNDTYSEVLSMSIPLTERAINIELDPVYTNNDSAKLPTNNNSIKVNKNNLLIAFCLCLVALLLFSIRLINLIVVPSLSTNTKYKKTVKKTLREYDRMITEISTIPNMEGCNVIKVVSFKELVDIRDNLKLPIMYFEIVKGLKSWFFIKNGQDIYLFVLKAADLD